MGAEGKTATDAGGLVIEILVSGELEPWIDVHGLMITCVRPTDERTSEALGGREWAYVVDLEQNAIIWKAFGSYSADDESSAKKGLAELQRLLGSP